MATSDTHHIPGSEMPIFTRTYDFLTWLLPVTNHFPRAHRHTVTRQLLDAAFDLRERLEEANLRQGKACHVRCTYRNRLAQMAGVLLDIQD
jgi:hypothetical protein